MFRPVFRTALAAAALSGAISSPVAAQDWARAMFDVKDHDFGVVARGSDTVFKFPVKNIYKEDVVLGGVRSSCGCTTASLEGSVIKTYDTGYVVAKFNTRTFTGVHSATLTVDVIRPFPAQVQVRVHGNIRGDVVFEPGSAEFGQFDQGTAQEKRVTVSYAGRAGWSVSDVLSTNDHLTAELVQRERNDFGKVVYELVLKLRDTAPAGLIKTQVVLVTNDAANPRIPLEVAAEVRPELVVSPDTIVLGDVPQGKTVTKKLLVRGKRPFRIADAKSEDKRLACEFSEAADGKHVVTLRFTAAGEAGRVKAPILFTTDLGESFTAGCTVYATVTPAATTAGDTSAAPTPDGRTALAN